MGLGAALLAPVVTSLLVPTPAEAADTCIPATACTPAKYAPALLFPQSGGVHQQDLPGHQRLQLECRGSRRSMPQPVAGRTSLYRESMRLP